MRGNFPYALLLHDITTQRKCRTVKYFTTCRRRLNLRLFRALCDDPEVTVIKHRVDADRPNRVSGAACLSEKMQRSLYL